MALPSGNENTVRTEQDYAQAERQKIISGQNIRTEMMGSISGKFQSIANESMVMRTGVARTFGNNIATQGARSVVGALSDVGGSIAGKLFGTGEKQYAEESSEIADEIDKSKLLKAVLDSMLRLEKIQSGGGTAVAKSGANLLPDSPEESKKMSELEKQRLQAEKFSESLKRKLVEIEQPSLGGVVQSNASNVTGTLKAGVQQGIFGALGSNVLSQTVLSGMGALNDTIELLLSKSAEKKSQPEAEAPLAEEKTDGGTPFPEINPDFDKQANTQQKEQPTDYDIPAYKRRAKGEKAVNEDPQKQEEPTNFDIPAYKRRANTSPTDVPFRDIPVDAPVDNSKNEEEIIQEGKKQSGILNSLLERMTEIRDYFKRTEKLSNSESDLESGQPKSNNALLERAKAGVSAEGLLSPESEKNDDGFGLDDAAALAAGAAGAGASRGGKPKPGTPGTPKKGFGLKRVLGGLGKGLVGATVGLAAGFASDKLEEAGHSKSAAGVDILGSAATGAGLGAMLGPVGAAVGGLAGAAYGTYQNWDKLTDSNADKIAKDKDKIEAASDNNKPSEDAINVINSNNTSVNNNQTNVVRKNIRNPDQTLNRYLAW